MTNVILLGTGNPNPDPNHLGPSVAIIANNTPYIVDFGSGIVRQATALTPNYGGNFPELNPKHLNIGFLTHLHSDHTLGFPDMIFTPWVMERSEPLKVYGPLGTRAMTKNILRAYQLDINYRLRGEEPINPHGYQVKVTEIEEGIIYIDENIQVEAFEVHHGQFQDAFGYRFTTPDKVIVISGDTAPCKKIQEYSIGADILIHEVYSQRGFEMKSAQWQTYHASHHTSTLQLATLAKNTKPEKLVTYHTLYWGSTDEEILEEIREIYDGEIIIGADLQIIT